jgi:hypothetical protein
MTTPHTVDPLDELVSETPSDTTSVTDTATSSTDSPDPADSPPVESESNGEDETYLAEIPEPRDNFVSITEFAAHMTNALFMKAIESGTTPDPSNYVVAQSVYQTVRAQKDQIPHIKVKAAGDEQARVYIDKANATPWWFARTERLATRGTGATARASSRSPEDNLSLLEQAAYAHQHALSRSALWAERVEQGERKVEKYKGFLSDQDVSEEDVAKAVQTGIDSYHADQAAKAENRKRNKTDESTDTE